MFKDDAQRKRYEKAQDIVKKKLVKFVPDI